jgi:hypothetical protein
MIKLLALTSITGLAAALTFSSVGASSGADAVPSIESLLQDVNRQIGRFRFDEASNWGTLAKTLADAVEPAQQSKLLEQALQQNPTVEQATLINCGGNHADVRSSALRAGASSWTSEIRAINLSEMPIPAHMIRGNGNDSSLVSIFSAGKGSCLAVVQPVSTLQTKLSGVPQAAGVWLTDTVSGLTVNLGAASTSLDHLLDVTHSTMDVPGAAWRIDIATASAKTFGWSNNPVRWIAFSLGLLAIGGLAMLWWLRRPIVFDTLS